MSDWAKWARVLSPASVKLWKHISRWPDEDTSMPELTRALGLSKTGVRQALDELQEHGFIAVHGEIEDGTEA